jgi:hypothetical protein
VKLEEEKNEEEQEEKEEGNYQEKEGYFLNWICLLLYTFEACEEEKRGGIGNTGRT